MTTDTERREASLALMRQRFPAVEERFRRAYGLRLPRHLGVFAAFCHSLSPAERAGMARLWLGSWGVAELFEDGGLERTARDGLDERLHCRFRRDPAEFVTVMSGGSDGLHFGLWYDDPAELPSFVAYNYARDSAETWTHGSQTLLLEIRGWLAGARSEAEDDPELPDPGDLLALEAALVWFADADREALVEDGPRRWAGAERPAGGVSIGPVLPPGSGDPRADQTGDRIARYRDPEATAPIVAQARAELAAGEPAYALSVGRELHWFDDDSSRAEATELLTGAYRALGRDALADIVEVHHANRDLRSVEIF